MKAYITADLFRAVSLFVSTDETRYYLCGVLVEPHPICGLLLTATDGHRLFNVWDKEGSMDGWPGIVSLPKALLKECKSKNAGRGGFRTVLRIDDGKPSIRRITSWVDKIELRTIAERGDLIASSEESCLVDGTFPEYRRVIPANVEGFGPAAFDARYLATFDEALRFINAYTGENRTGLSVVGQDSGSPAIVRTGYDFCMGVMMPMRFAGEVFGQRPVYLDAKPYDRPRVKVTRPEGNRVYFSGSAEPVSWSFDVLVSLSALTGETRRAYTFKTKPQAARAFNRILAGLHARGMCSDLEPVYPHYDLKPDAVKAMEDRAERIKEAREAFEAAEPIDLGRPWQRNVVVEFETRVMNRYAVERLPALSEGRALASLYRAAA